MQMLPLDLQRNAQRALTLAAIRAIGAYVLVLTAMVAIALTVGRVVLERNFRSVVERSTLVLRTHEGTFREIRAANEFLRTFERFQDDATPWAATIAAIADAVPPGVRLRELSIDRDRTTLLLAGRAVRREDLLAFQDRLRAAPFLRDVAIPFSHFLQRERIDFTAEARIDRTRLPTTP